MPLRSHVDLCLFARFIYVADENVPEEVLASLGQQPDSTRALNAWRAETMASPSLIFHEAYHYWQGLRLPYLYATAIIAFENVLRIANTFSKISKDYHRWDGGALGLDVPTMKETCLYRADGSFALGGDNRDPGQGGFAARLSPIDLLETSASIAEFQASTPMSQCADPRSFSRWSKRNPAYLDAYRFLAAIFGDEELALRCFNPLVETAFHTNQPLLCFLHFAQAVVGVRPHPKFQRFIVQREPCRWSDYFQGVLKQIPFQSDTDHVGPLFFKPFCRLTLDYWIERYTPADRPHPLLTRAARAWAASARSDPAYSLVLGQTAWAGRHAVDDVMERFEPPLTVVRFSMRDGRNFVSAIGSKFNQLDLWGASLPQWMALYGTIRRATGHFTDPDFRLCHHDRCPEYDHNSCNSYPFIPARYQDCGFPEKIVKICEILAS